MVDKNGFLDVFGKETTKAPTATTVCGSDCAKSKASHPWSGCLETLECPDEPDGMVYASGKSKGALCAPPGTLTKRVDCAETCFVPEPKAVSWYATFSEKTCKENDAGDIQSLAECSKAGESTYGKTATDDGQDGASDDPSGCYHKEVKDVKFNVKKTNKGECTPKDPCICWDCDGGGGTVKVDLKKNEFLKITDIPKNAWGIKIKVRSPRTGSRNGADLDVMLMEPGRLPYFEDLTGAKSGDKIATDGQHKGKRVDASGKLLVNYPECIAGFNCKNSAKGFDATAAGDDDAANEKAKADHKKANGDEAFKMDFKLPKSGGGFNNIMKVYFGGDDFDGHVIEEEVRIEGTRKSDGTIDNKVTEELPLWVFAYPIATEAMCGDLEIGDTCTKALKEAKKCGTIKKWKKCPEPDFQGLVTYSFEGIDPCPGH
jgi:hypothetical protein